MSKQRIHVDMLYREGENIFDVYYNLIETEKLYRRRQESDEEYPDYDTLIKALTILERNIDDLAADKKIVKGKFKSISEITVFCLKEWVKIFETLMRQPIFIEAFAYNTLALSILIFQSRNIDLIDFHRDVLFLSPSRKDKLAFDEAVDQFTREQNVESRYKRLFDSLADELSRLVILKHRKKSEIFDAIEDLISKLRPQWNFGPNSEIVPILSQQIRSNFERNIFAFIDFTTIKELDNLDVEEFRESINNKSIHESIEKIRSREYLEYEWDVQVIIKGGEFKSSKIGFLMWAMSTAVESIENVSVRLDDWGNGSKMFNLKLYIKDLLAKDEVKQVLGKARNAVEANYLDKPIEEAGKLKAEKEKTLKEADNLRSKEEASVMFDLERQEKQLEIMDKAADLALKKIQIIRGFSELIKEGILGIESDFEIIINSIVFIQKKDGKIFIGEHLDIIEEKEIKNEKEGGGESKLHDEGEKVT